MKRLIFIALFTTAAFAQTPAGRVAEDAIVVDRVAEAAKRDLPADLLKRIVSEDIDLLRGKRADGTFEFATYERLESGRKTQSYSIQPRKDKMDTVEMKGAFIYRVIVDVPKRRLLVGRNRPVWIERIDVDYLGLGNAQLQQTSLEVKAWVQPGETKPIDLPAVARQATAKIIATADPKQGYGNVEITLIEAKIVDNADSPYADAVSSAKAIVRGLENNDIKSIRAMAQRMRSSLGGAAGSQPAVSGSSIDVTTRRAESAPLHPNDTATQLELQTELQLIEDLLTGNESERREGLDRLHQMIRRLRR